MLNWVLKEMIRLGIILVNEINKLDLTILFIGALHNND